MISTNYASTAYSSDKLNGQSATQLRSGFRRLTGRRLPWGDTQEVIPGIFMTPEPDALRDIERMKQEKEDKLVKGTYKPAPMERIDFHDRCDHEHFRYAPWSGRSHFWIYLISFGKGGFFFFLIFGAWVALLDGFKGNGFFISFWRTFELVLYWFLLPSLFFWSFASIIIHKLPRLWVKPGKGPKWELNRRTGMITLFEYRGKNITEKRAPFHEFDAYINTTPDRQGLPMNVLSLEHRYEDIRIFFGDLQPPDRNTQQLCALWDFIQNYMDTSRPLPDAPLFEEHRPNDPTTAEHDQTTGRNLRYWIDMDDDTFKKEQMLMRTRVNGINTFSRANLMARYVTYPL